MRVAYLINQYPTISHSFIRREILALERRGFEVLRISIRGWDVDLVDPEDLYERERTRYVLRSGAPALLIAAARMLLTRPMHLLRALAMAWHMSRCSERPLPVHLVYIMEACCIEPWLREAGVVHLHAHFGTNSAEVAMLVHILGGPRWSFTAHGTETFDNPRLVGLTDKVMRCSFAVAVSSYGRAQIYRSVEPRHWGKIHVVGCGLDQAFLSAPVFPVQPSRRLVCVGRLSPEKGHIVLVEAARKLSEQGADFELVLAGDGPLRADIEALLVQRGLNNRVRITGWLNGEQVRSEIVAARALVLTSFSEGLPVVLMEAMAMARPVIATFVAGIPELVQHGQHGWLVPAGDVDALVEAMWACLNSGSEALRAMGKAARARILERPDADAGAGRLANLFRETVARRDHAGGSGVLFPA